MVYREVCTEVSQTAVPVLKYMNHIQRHKYPGEQAHLCEALRIPKGIYVDVAGIGTRIFTLPREIFRCRVHGKKSAEAIVAIGKRSPEKQGGLTK